MYTQAIRKVMPCLAMQCKQCKQPTVSKIQVSIQKFCIVNSVLDCNVNKNLL